MSRFVVLTHDWPSLHWDFLVEREEVLAAWRLLAEPRAGVDILAELNTPHRPFYLDYEGPVSGERGIVSRWDAGVCEWLSAGADHAEIALCGEKLAGRVVLLRQGGAWSFRLKALAQAK